MCSGPETTKVLFPELQAPYGTWEMHFITVESRKRREKNTVVKLLKPGQGVEKAKQKMLSCLYDCY